MESLSPPISPPRDNNVPRPRTTSALSFTSNHSRRSNSSGGKLDLTETSKDKKRLNTKADPSKALSEDQPAAVALQDSNLEDLRSFSHKDEQGNPILDPDRSNPTRNRFERPLDTIRRFQAAAEGSASKRLSNRPLSQASFNPNQSQRNSYYGSYNAQQRPRPAPASTYGGYYRNSSYGGYRQESFVEEGQEYNQPYHGQGLTRNSSAPIIYQNTPPDNAIMSHHHQQSYETATSGSDEYGKSTNPSSQNSSFDRIHQMRKPDEHAYEAQNGYSAPANRPYQYGPAQGGMSNGLTNGKFNGMANGAANDTFNGMFNGISNGTAHDVATGLIATSPQRGPPPPPKQYYANNTRVPIKLDTGSGAGTPTAKLDRTTSTSGKRQSWFKRTFSRRET